MLRRKNKGLSATVFNAANRQNILSAATPFAIKEAYTSLRTNLMFTSKGEACAVYAVTSSLPNDGKTINTINIAISFAQTGKRVLLIDGDLRNSLMHRYFNIQTQDGLSEYLAGINRKAGICVPEIENLFFIPAGKSPPNPAELLGSERMRELLEDLRHQFDYIFIDTPPVEMVADASVIADMITGYVFVVKNGSTDITVTRHSVQALEQVNAKLVGFVLNNADAKNSRYYKGYGYSKYGYKYGYGYGYGQSK